MSNQQFQNTEGV